MPLPRTPTARTGRHLRRELLLRWRKGLAARRRRARRGAVQKWPKSEMVPSPNEMPATISLPELSVQRKTSKKIAEIASSMMIQSVMQILMPAPAHTRAEFNCPAAMTALPFISFHARRKLESDARAEPPLMSGLMANSSAVAPES